MSQAALIIDMFLEILTWLIFARVILSFIRHNPRSPIIRMLYEGTEPMLAPFRKLMPKSSIPLDFSPLLAFLVIRFIRFALLRLL